MTVRVPVLLLLGLATAATIQSPPVSTPALNQTASGVIYSDIANQARLAHTNTYGGRSRKDYILETTGNGVAIFDFDSDGWSDLLFANGRTIEQNESTQPGALVLYRNDGTGRLSDITAKAG